ncbi:hypothetical protein CPC735_019510 [Coccidioides posadasii C735 delta SOWgp]|uniref:HNH nuclease domain-containing protein n=1 Tax=Coccidioides posadasii (strain C735) TaxID=222929 RepID=C5PE33_COCP7|nr:hypothetical protein CPC735_019510 [Coccidioides posadasii C735 delta SOWgp]EER25344.1 hypothetical protein CPC735_019510 [Coccidioides posadasii C735 delta SOWgp]|eukprot:XP_003067489.1 hypothetical protein CPC735_019510 [Coccidioides posadasii C735 delta SOWgp]
MASHHRRPSSYEGAFDLPGRSHVPFQPLHCHRVSFDGLIDYSSLAPLTADERSRAQEALDRIIHHLANHSGSKGGYSRHLLVCHSYDYSQSELSKDTFLRVFFNVMGLDISSDEDINTGDDQLPPKFIHFADTLLKQFFFPCLCLKATGKITPQPSPAQLSAMQSVQSPHEIVGTFERVSYLRALCLVRDQHRCVISQVFDAQQEVKQTNQHGLDAQDDDGNLLKDEDRFDDLEVAHILPHSLTQMNENLYGWKTMIDILNMFDCDVAHLIEGSHIDSPHNAISLTPTFHKSFGNFEVYFDTVAGEEHTYRIDSFLNPVSAARRGLPVTRKLLLSEGRAIDAPSPQLLALHRAIAHILHLSGAGEYIDKILQDFEETGVQEDGSTDLGHIVDLRLGGWLDGAGEVH